MPLTDHQLADEIRHTFAQSIFAKVRALETLELTPRQRARLCESIASDVRKACDLVASTQVSEAAHQAARGLGIELAKAGWHDQPKFDRGRTRFHLEHVQTVAAICEAVRGQSSVDGVVGVLERDLRVAWILKTEDRKLTKLGYRKKRPDPDAAYREAGITLRVK